MTYRIYIVAYLSFLQDENFKDVCNVPLSVVTNIAPEDIRLTSMAKEIEEKFTLTFQYYANCHMLFNSSKAVDPDQLGKYKIQIIESLLSSKCISRKRAFLPKIITQKMILTKK